MSVPDSGGELPPKAKFCPRCGTKNTALDRHCGNCGFDFASLPGGQYLLPQEPLSEKSFGVAVALCGIFGILGIHHFYLGNYLHGIIDAGMVALAVFLFAQGGAWDGVAIAVVVVDVVHSIIVMIQLFTGSARDGQGRKVPYPGQMNH